MVPKLVEVARETIPTKAQVVHVPDKPVVFKALALGGGKVHIDFHSIRATRATVLRRKRVKLAHR